MAHSRIMAFLSVRCCHGSKCVRPECANCMSMIFCSYPRSDSSLAARERIPSKDSFTPSYPRLRRETVMVDMSMGRSGERTPGNSKVPSVL